MSNMTTAIPLSTSGPGTSKPSAAATTEYDTIVVGAGFAGLTLAIALAEGLPTGHRIALVDRRTMPVGARDSSIDARAVALSAASVRLLTTLGIWPQIQAFAQPVSSIELTDSALKAGIRPVLLSYETALDTGERSAFILPNAILEAACAEAAASRKAITAIGGVDVTRLITDPEFATLTLSDGRSLRARLIVGTDGRRSKMRELAEISTVGWRYAQSGITVTVAHDEPHGGKAVQHFLPGGPFALLPLPGNRTCITWSEKEAEAARIMALDDDAFLAEADRRVGGRLGTIRLDGRRQSWPLEMFMARSFVGTRVALAGDAAHGVHPIAGQGLNLGLKDVAALAEVVVDQARVGLDVGAPCALARYERWRRFDTFTAAAGFDALNRLFSNDTGLLRTVRSMGLGMVDNLPFLKRALVAEAAGTTGTLPRLIRGEAL
jgi:2-octaprenyl-6-methoxyphenol hydroxylase